MGLRTSKIKWKLEQTTPLAHSAACHSVACHPFLRDKILIPKLYRQATGFSYLLALAGSTSLRLMCATNAMTGRCHT